MTLNVTNLTVLQAGKLVPLGPGDTLVVEVSFVYTCAEAVDADLWASLGISIGRDMENLPQDRIIHLEQALTPTTWEGVAEIPIPATGKTNGTYWMKVEINGTEVTVQDAVVISGFVQPWDVLELIPMLMLVMMMSVVMGVMEE